MIVDVWCNACDQPATVEVRLTSGRTVSKCATHAVGIAGREQRTVNADFDRHRYAAVCGIWLQPDGSAVDLWPKGGPA